MMVVSRNKIIYGYGDYNAKIVFIGLAPGRNGADITGVPFTKDPSGILFQDALIKSGFSSEKIPTIWKPRLKEVYVTNLVKCNPKDKNGNNREPTKEEITNCSEYLQKELSIINPKLIVTFGKIVTEYLFGEKIKSFHQWHNKPIEKNGIRYVPFIHPSYVIRGAYNKQQYIQEFMSLKNYLTY